MFVNKFRTKTSCPQTMHFLILQGVPPDKGVVDRSFKIGLKYVCERPRTIKNAQVSTVVATQVINSKLPQSFSFENPIVWLVSLFTSDDVIVSRTAFSSLSILNLIFVIPRQACCKTCFFVAVGTLAARLSASRLRLVCFGIS